MEMLQKATDEIIKLVQNKYFKDEMERMKSKEKNFNKESPLYSLDPFLDECGII